MLNTVLNTQNKLDWNFTAQTDIHNDKTICFYPMMTLKNCKKHWNSKKENYNLVNDKFYQIQANKNY